ncbi:small subunit ribosomal protein S8e [Pancytospora philotis]|nr:small subunit ribosomal protein S8e [Pancytospora philotis]
MGITTCGMNKRSKTGAKFVKNHKKRKNCMGRQPASTKIGEERIREVRVRGGNIKPRALRLNNGEFTFLSTGAKSSTQILNVVYHPSSNELMRTNTLTKGSVVRLDAAPFLAEMGKDERCQQDASLVGMANKGFMYGVLTSRPGQIGEANGYILQGAELKFYENKMNKQKKLVK